MCLSDVIFKLFIDYVHFYLQENLILVEFFPHKINVGTNTLKSFYEFYLTRFIHICCGHFYLDCFKIFIVTE